MIPQLPQPLLIAVLRVLAMLVLNVASTFQMFARRPDVNATRQMPVALPRMKTDTLKEQHAVQQDSSLNSAHGEQRSFAARPSNHERVLTAPSPSVSLATQAIHLPLLRRWRTERGMSSTAERGRGGSPRLRGETEGASHTHLSLRSSRQTPGSRASREICIQPGPHQQAWPPACARMSGSRAANRTPV